MMNDSTNGNLASDPYDLSRFIRGQEGSYERALSEIRSGRKRSHWMWYIFPQYQGLAFSSTSVHYAIKSLDEARAFLAHPLLGSRLLECADALLQVQGRSASEVLGYPDDLKLQSCATLFALVSPADSVFERLIQKFYEGHHDDQTRHLLKTGT